MRASVTYIHHDCFVLRLGDRTLLFDWPDAEHRTPAAEAAARREVAGTDLWVFFSHSHPDHCSADVQELARAAARARYVLSFDVPDMVPELDLEGAFVVEPDEASSASPEAFLDAEGVRLSCLEANDLGVAFLIECEGVKLYFSGDLALWDWPESDAAARRFTEEYFAASLARVAAFAPAVALVNADPRLASWSGACRVAQAVRPRLFVPMHAFGDTGRVAAFAADCRVPGVDVFAYAAPGDTRELTL
jgi:L-ascorbate metabolism protein UlaG (beta-lactamase superfamily)